MCSRLGVLGSPVSGLTTHGVCSHLVGTPRGGSAAEEGGSQHHWSPFYPCQEYISICIKKVLITLENTVF